tara:strand:+ start:3661 stop:3834 length:174 start_codon:yes stop_codon:yes gene_type:complete
MRALAIVRSITRELEKTPLVNPGLVPLWALFQYTIFPKNTNKDIREIFLNILEDIFV